MNFIKTLKILLIIDCILTFIIGTYWTIVMFIPLGGIHDTFAAAVSQFSGFLLFLYLLTTVLFLKLIPREGTWKLKRNDDANSNQLELNQKLIRRVVAVFGLSLVFINTLPLLMTPISILNAESQFEEAYGPSWRDDIPSDVNSYFLQTQFSLAGYYMGVPHKDCRIETEIQYYSDGNGMYLTFDVYYPHKTTSILPGRNSTIIKIHGGGWTAGDKSEFNMLYVNKYLAAQGYVVFDIQYGLNNASGVSSMGIPTPDHVKGNFSLHDMIEHIGYFTKQLEVSLATTYHANLSSVYIMGNSAGGHLTGVFGLGYNDPYFAGNFSNALTIKGIIPIYPANDAILYFSSGSHGNLIPGTPQTNPLAYEKFTPSKLADSNDPAALIFQGTNDGMVPPKNSEDIKAALNNNSVKALLLTFPLAAHAADFMANNNFAQPWLYYLERFLYLQQ